MRSFAISLLCLIALSTAFCQKKSLTLEQAKQIALERNLSVVQAQNNMSSAQSQVMSARGLYLPTLSASSSWNRSRQQFESSGSTIINGISIPISASQVSMSNNFSGGVSANWSIFDGFGREATNSAATANAVASEQSFARTRQSIVFQTISFYLNVLRTQELVKVSEENLKRDQRQLERITESNRVGALSLADVYRQQSQVSADELALINAQNNFDKAKADLIALVGLDVADDYDVVDVTIPAEIDTVSLRESAAMVRSYSSLASRALQARPDFMAAQQSLNAAQSNVNGARSSYFPTVGLFGSYNRTGDDVSNPFKNSSSSWGARLSWSLFDGFRRESSVQSAIASKRNAEIQLAQAEIGVNVDVKKALLDLDASSKSYEVSLKGLRSATEDSKIAEERYNLGAGTLLDLLTANANLVNAQANKVNAVYGFLNSKFNLEYAVGERSY
jgi:outer membrane protein